MYMLGSIEKQASTQRTQKPILGAASASLVAGRWHYHTLRGSGGKHTSRRLGRIGRKRRIFRSLAARLFPDIDIAEIYVRALFRHSLCATGVDGCNTEYYKYVGGCITNLTSDGLNKSFLFIK